MKRSLLRGVAELALFQGVWWAAVGGAGAGSYWLGPLAVALQLAATLALAPAGERRRLALAAPAIGLAGLALDSTLQALGLIRFAGAPAPWLAPAWIGAMWVQIALALPALARFADRPVALALAGAAGAPFAYAAGVRLGAAGLVAEPRLVYATLAALWSLILPLLARSFAVAPPPARSVEPAPEASR